MIARALVSIAVGTALLAIAAAAPAQDPARTRLLAANCASCHGIDGRSLDGMPSLAGLSKDAIVAAMQDFKSGKRPATVMQQLAKGYADADIDAIAGWFAAGKR